MGKLSWKPGNMLYPLPVALVSVADRAGRKNVFTVAWVGTVCSDPPMVSISVRKERHSYHMIRETGEFVINLTTAELAFATDYCGVKSGRDVDKLRTLKLTPLPADKVRAPLIKESPVNIECRVVRVEPLGSHDMFLAEVLGVTIEDSYLNEKNKFELNNAGLVSYSHGEYFVLGERIGKFGYSVEKKRSAKRKRK